MFGEDKKEDRKENSKKSYFKADMDIILETIREADYLDSDDGFGQAQKKKADNLLREEVEGKPKKKKKEKRPPQVFEEAPVSTLPVPEFKAEPVEPPPLRSADKHSKLGGLDLIGSGADAPGQIAKQKTKSAKNGAGAEIKLNENDLYSKLKKELEDVKAAKKAKVTTVQAELSRVEEIVDATASAPTPVAPVAEAPA